MWMVDCKPGKEKELAYNILNKFSQVRNKKDMEFKIISASALERHKGNIFVEAWNK